MVNDAVQFSPGELDRSARFYVAGHRGLAGSAIARKLQNSGFENVIGRTSAELDLRDREPVFDFFADTKPKYVVLAAARVGGILANDTYPSEFLSDNIRIQVNVLDAARTSGVERLLFLSSSCVYPKFAKQPIREDELLTGALEPTNEAYAIAKIAGMLHIRAIRRQYGLPWIAAMPSNLYGPNDNFSLGDSHFLPALIRRYDEATRAGLTSVTNWGTGNQRRELLHADDLAEACLYLLENYDGPEHINVGSGVDATIQEIAGKVAAVVGFTGKTLWDTGKPDGTPRKLLDVSKMAELGWTAQIGLQQGIERTVAWYREFRESSARC